MIALVKITQESQITGELHVNKLQKLFTLLALGLTNARKTKKNKKK